MKHNQWVVTLISIVLSLWLVSCNSNPPSTQDTLATSAPAQTPVVAVSTNPLCEQARTDPSVLRLSPAVGSFTSSNPADFAQADSFTSLDKLVATYYFYWYDVDTGEHWIDGDADMAGAATEEIRERGVLGQ